MLDFKHFNSICPFHNDRCFYKIIGNISNDGYRDVYNMQSIHTGFENFAKQLQELFGYYQKVISISSTIGITIHDIVWKDIAGYQLIDKTNQSHIPLWTNSVKFNQLKDLETKKQAIDEEINTYEKFLPLLYSSGKTLEDAVEYTFQFLGLKTQRTKEGANIDMYASTLDNAISFGIEVTGVKGAIKKDSNKVSQIVTYEIQKDDPKQKGILIANTYNDTPIEKRDLLENFTKQAAEVFDKNSILFTTGLDLYKLIQDIFNNKKTKEEVINILYSNKGEYKYK
jgi:hypothetical protein